MIEKLIEFLYRRRGAGESGSAAVEFAITAPLLVVLALGIADYGTLMANTASLEGATRAAAEYARNSAACAAGGLGNGSCITGLDAFVATLKSNDTSLSSASFSFPAGDLSPAGGNFCTCVDGTAVDCATATCSVGGDARVLQYIQITATQSFSPLISYVTFGFPATLSGQTTTRAE